MLCAFLFVLSKLLISRQKCQIQITGLHWTNYFYHFQCFYCNLVYVYWSKSDFNYLTKISFQVLGKIFLFRTKFLIWILKKCFLILFKQFYCHFFCQNFCLEIFFKKSWNSSKKSWNSLNIAMLNEFFT